MSVAEEERRGDDEQGAGGGVDLPLSSKVKMLDQCFTMKMELLSHAKLCSNMTSIVTIVNNARSLLCIIEDILI